jgi:hypothetical protein
VRRSKWTLAIVFAMELTAALFIRNAGLYNILPAVCAYLIGLYLTMDVIQLDWPSRGLQFISTRPVPGEALFFAKFLYPGLFLILGTWGFQELDYAFAGLPFGPLDHLFLLIESAIHSGTAVAFVALFALFLRKKSHIFYWAFGLYVLTILAVDFAGIIFPSIAATSHGLNHAQLWWNGLVVLFGMSGFIGVAMFTALLRYRTRRFGLPFIFVIGASILDLVICLGAIRIGEGRLAHDRTGKLPPHLREQIHFTNDASSQQGEQPDHTEWNVRDIYQTVPGSNIEGIEAPYYCRILGSQSIATLRSGKTFRSAADQAPMIPGEDFGDMRYVPFQAKVIGVSQAASGVTYNKPETRLPAFTYLTSRLPAGEDLTGVTIKGDVRLEIHRAYVAGSIPVKPGAIFSRRRERYEITDVSTSGASGIFFIRLASVWLPLILRGDTDDSSPILTWALISRSRNELLDSESGSSFPFSFPVNFANSTMLYSRPSGPEPGELPPPRDLLKDAEIVFIGNETCGEITVPYKVDNVTLAR